MGTWDIGPFENDTAADFANALDETAPDERESLVRSTLLRAAQSRDDLDADYGAEAVAAAARIAAQYPGGAPVEPPYGPEQSLPVFSPDLRGLAVDALDRVLAEDSELAELWDETEDGPLWRADVDRIRAVLDPAPGRPQEETLFEA
ncbi:DUF4259 domain-containing protein [Kitasatospora sp. NPDC093806]|uniref:DUF4259 domain-containing protein n=1 Tax=Kitasatospora sp. NPDC093806 TaxID=3155075 RepID=UPI00342076D3